MALIPVYVLYINGVSSSMNSHMFANTLSLGSASAATIRMSYSRSAMEFSSPVMAVATVTPTHGVGIHTITLPPGLAYPRRKQSRFVRMPLSWA